MSKSKIPNALRVDLTDDMAGQSQFIETRVIEPVNGADQHQVRFLLPQEGILDKDAFISFKVQLPAGLDAVLPQWAGAMSAISTATLMCGGVQICQSRGINHLWTLKNFYRDPHNRNEKQAKRVGCNTSLMVDKLVGDAAEDSGCWGVDVNQDNTSAPTDDTRRSNEGYRITDDLATTPEWVVYLEELFPLLYQNNLPLGLLQDPISIVLDLQQEQTRGDRTCCDDGVWATGTSYQSWKLHADLIFFDDPINAPTTMDKLQDKLNNGLALPFTDYAYVLQSQPAAGTDTDNQSVNTLLGLDHQVVRRIFASTPKAPDYAAPQNSGNALLGNYHSLGSNLKNTLQVTINSQPYYPSPVDSDGKLQNQLNQCFPTPHKINQAIQSAKGQVNNTTGAYVPAQQQLTSKTMNGMSQQLQQGCGHYYGIPLSRSYANELGQGTAVGRQSVLMELQDQRCATGNDAKQVHIWAECERLLMMRNGKVAVSGA